MFVALFMLPWSLVALQATSATGAMAKPPSDLPGDAPLPPLDRQLAMPLGPPAGAPAKPLSPIPGDTLPISLASKAAETALNACRAAGYRVGVAVIDRQGQLRTGLADDGAAPGRIYVAIRKDLAAVEFGVSSLRARELVRSDPMLRTRVAPNMALFAGAEPLTVGTRLVGAIGVSGSTQNQDAQCAAAGAAAIRGELK